MRDPITAYLNKRAVHRQWPATPVNGVDVDTVVAIPVLAESARLFQTLSDLAQQDPARLQRTVVVCVVNNRAPAAAGTADCDDNQQTLARLPDFAAAHPELRLAWVDAASPGRELGPKDGVGLARKIGLDWGVQWLHDRDNAEGVLVCLDADTRVPPAYLAAIHDFFTDSARWAAIVDYAHPVDGPDTDETRAILAYELFLRYQELALHHAGSPYHYPAIGSTMICTAKAYTAVGGMNRRQAGEDFYFLQQLAKTGTVERIRATAICPASRPSHRVPFGTGRKVGAFPGDPDDAYRTYDPDTYRILRAWLETATSQLEADGDTLVHAAQSIHPELGRFLVEQGFADAWDRMGKQGRTETRRLQQFHEWFDAFRTLKLTHHLRDRGYPRRDLFEALGTVMDWQGVAAPVQVDAGLRHDLDGQRALLATLRAWRP